jgi:cellulose synthase operon protein C
MSIPTPVEPSRSRAAGPAVALFELPADRFPSFAAQLRRLCPQPLRFRWLPGDPDRVLVRVESPTNLLIDRFRDAVQSSAPVDDPAAFLEEIDYLPLGPGSAAGGTSQLDRIETRLRLSPIADGAAAHLWVLRTDALAQFAAFCRTTNELLLNRFTVAVSASAGVPCVILRAVRGKGPPPVFLDPAEAYRPLLPFPNLYLPTNARLGPALRRDAVRDALGLKADRVVWLHRLADGGFRPESLPEAAFRPLPEWVEYKVADAVRRPAPWAQSFRLDLEQFAERTDPRPVPKPRPAEPPAKPRRSGRGLLTRASEWFKGLKLRPPEPRPVPPEPPPAAEEPPRPFLSQGERLHHARPETANAALERCQILEAGFLQNMGARADAGDAWIDLATAYDAAGNHADAALCWLNGLWSQDPIPPKLAWAWLRAEAKAARSEVKEIDPRPWLATAPGPGTTRAMAAWVVWASVQNPRAAALVERAAELQARLEAQEHWLPVRAAWLARLATSRAGDVLGLARTRDRLSERLLTSGLSLELDTPSFLRFAGDGVRERFHEARRWLMDKRDLIHQWIARLPDDATVRGPDGSLRRFGLEPNVAQTRAYADLVLVWGLTRFAEHTSAEAVRRQAATGFPADDPAHAVLREAFDFRTTQVREGKPPKGPLPTHLLRQIEALAADPRYVVDKLRAASRVLEPTARVEEYRGAVSRRGDAAGPPAIALLPAERLNAEAGAILARERQRAGQPDLAAVMIALLGRAGDLDEAAVELACESLPVALDAARNAPHATAGLAEHGLTAAALWDRADLARMLVSRFTAATPGPAWTDVAEPLIGPATRSLRRLGLTAEVDRLLQHVVERTTQGLPPARLRVAKARDWPAALRVLLHAAGGWYGSGRSEQAHAVLDEARKDLFAPGLSQSDRTALALAYATTLGQAPVRVALGRLEEMFQRLKGVSVSGTTNTHYCLRPLLLIETAVRAIVSEDFTLGPQVRAWLDADEFAVRRRIRDDLKAVLISQGL